MLVYYGYQEASRVTGCGSRTKAGEGRSGYGDKCEGIMIAAIGLVIMCTGDDSLTSVGGEMQHWRIGDHVYVDDMWRGDEITWYGDTGGIIWGGGLDRGLKMGYEIESEQGRGVDSFRHRGNSQQFDDVSMLTMGHTWIEIVDQLVTLRPHCKDCVGGLALQLGERILRCDPKL
ncbi:hypothetical protein Tco_0667436 [Tanacetum coccineum]